MQGGGAPAVPPILRLFWQHRPRFLRLALLGLAAGAVTAWFWPHWYRGSVQLAVVPPASRSEEDPAVLSLHTYREILMSTSMVQRLYGLWEANPEFTHRPRHTGRMRRYLGVQIVEEGRNPQGMRVHAPLLTLSFDSKDPDTAVGLVEQWRQFFETDLRDLHERVRGTVPTWLASAYKQSEEDLLAAEKALKVFHDENDLDLLESTRTTLVDTVEEMRRTLVTLRNDRSVKTSRLTALEALRRSLEIDGRWIGLSGVPRAIDPSQVGLLAQTSAHPVLDLVDNIDALREEQGKLLAASDPDHLQRAYESTVEHVNAMREELDAARLRQEADRDALETVRAALDSTPKAIALRRTIPDEVVAEILVSGERARTELDEAVEIQFDFEELNPAFKVLQEDLVQLQRDAARSKAEVRTLGRLIDDGEAFVGQIRPRQETAASKLRIVDRQLEAYEKQLGEQLAFHLERIDEQIQLLQEVQILEAEIRSREEQLGTLETAIAATRQEFNRAQQTEAELQRDLQEAKQVFGRTETMYVRASGSRSDEMLDVWDVQPAAVERLPSLWKRLGIGLAIFVALPLLGAFFLVVRNLEPGALVTSNA